MTEIKFYLQRTDDRRIWEEVDEYSFKYSDKAILPNGEARYTGNRIWKCNAQVFMDIGKGVDATELGVIARFLSVKIEGGSLPGGFVRNPESVKFAFPQNRIVLHEMFGDNFKKAA